MVIYAKAVCQKGRMGSEDGVFCGACKNVTNELLDSGAKAKRRISQQYLIQEIDENGAVGSGADIRQVVWGKTHGGSDKVVLTSSRERDVSEPIGALNLPDGACGETLLEREGDAEGHGGAGGGGDSGGEARDGGGGEGEGVMHGL